MAAKSETYIDFVVRFSKPRTFMRSQVLRAESEEVAVRAALAAVTDGPWRGWSIVDVMTVDEAKARLGVAGG